MYFYLVLYIIHNASSKLSRGFEPSSSARVWRNPTFCRIRRALKNPSLGLSEYFWQNSAQDLFSSMKTMSSTLYMLWILKRKLDKNWKNFSSFVGYENKIMSLVCNTSLGENIRSQQFKSIFKSRNGCL